MEMSKPGMGNARLPALPLQAAQLNGLPRRLAVPVPPCVISVTVDVTWPVAIAIAWSGTAAQLMVSQLLPSAPVSELCTRTRMMPAPAGAAPSADVSTLSTPGEGAPEPLLSTLYVTLVRVPPSQSTKLSVTVANAGSWRSRQHA